MSTRKECEGWEEEGRREDGRKKEDGRKEEEGSKIRRIDKGFEKEERRKGEMEGEREEEGKGGRLKEGGERIWKGGRSLENLSPWETTFDDEFD